MAAARRDPGFSALQRAEIAEMICGALHGKREDGFSALQRAEIAEIAAKVLEALAEATVSVLFNEPKLLKSFRPSRTSGFTSRFSALQRAEIAEIFCTACCTAASAVWSFSALQRAEIAEMFSASTSDPASVTAFQCSSTSRNC